MVNTLAMDNKIPLVRMKKRVEMKYKHYFRCAECGSVSSYLSEHEVYDKKNATFETSCLCGIMQHAYLQSKVIER